VLIFKLPFKGLSEIIFVRLSLQWVPHYSFQGYCLKYSKFLGTNKNNYEKNFTELLIIKKSPCATCMRGVAAGHCLVISPSWAIGSSSPCGPSPHGPIIIFLPLYPCVIPISTYNPSYEQWLIGMGVHAGCLLLLSWRW